MKLLLSIFFSLTFLNAFNQCFQIESILVDACGSPEGPNEMVRLRIGPNDLNTSNLNANWPNNGFQGICQNVTTAAKVSNMNATIQSCGYFLEPTGGVLPANSIVLIITSTDFDETSHSYAGLTDTIYVIFQCAGNTSGHFANWVTNCDPLTGSRITSINFGTGCSQVVIYNRCDLINQNGTIGGTAAIRDGARVDFDASGNATYENDGCTIPYVPLNISIQPLANNVICDSVGTNINALTSGIYQSLEWNSNDGFFNDPNDPSTIYTPQTSPGSHFIYLTAVNGCGDIFVDSIEIIIDNSPNIQITENIISNDCSTGSIELIASGADNYQWNNGETTATIYPSSSNTYTVIGQNSCGSSSASVDVELGVSPNCSLNYSDSVFFCASDVSEVTLIANSVANSIVWNTGETSGTITIQESGLFYFTASNDCGTCSDSVVVTFIETQALIDANPPSGSMPLNVTFNDMSTDNTSSYWILDNFDTLFTHSFEFLFEEMGEYTIVLIALNEIHNCIDSTSVTIIVSNEPEIKIPNVFSPNNDGINDYFFPDFKFIDLKEAVIFDRWGKEVFSFSGNEKWNGNDSKNSKCSDGVYFYIMNFEKNNGEIMSKQGNITLISE